MICGHYGKIMSRRGYGAKTWKWDYRNEGKDFKKTFRSMTDYASKIRLKKRVKQTTKSI
jgi:hypothetical protein